jgi:chromosomal replication initiation ATPase DnaA
MPIEIPAIHKDRVDSLTREYASHIKAVLGIPILVKFSITSSEIEPDLLKDLVCEHYGVRWITVRTQTRKRDVVTARQVFCYLCRILTSLDDEDIAELVSKDRTTSIHSFNAIKHHLSAKDEYVTNGVNSILGIVNKFYNEYEQVNYAS